MKREDIISLIRREKLIVILRGVPLDSVGDIARAMVDGGVKLMEITINQKSPDPVKEVTAQMKAMKEAVGDALCIGTGTVLTAEQVEAAHAAGAQYIISPNTSEAVIRRTLELGMVSIPGAMTPSEIANAWQFGADIIKLFPADDLGYHYIRNITAPLSHIPLLATGGVNPTTIPEFLHAGAIAVGTGISIVKQELLAAKDYKAMTELAKAHINAIKTS